MAFTQDADSKKGIAEINGVSDNGYSYIMIGSIWFVVVQGSSAVSELKDAPKGSLILVTDTAKLLVKSSVGDGSTNATFTDLTATS